MRDEVDLIMKRLRTPWRERERVGGQVREREKRRESQKDTEVEREGKREVTQGVERGGGYLAIGSE